MIIIVSGLPRSGTSLMMQMLAAAGIPILSDDVRPADDSSPRGYYEWAPIKQLSRSPSILAKAEGKAVKIVSPLLLSLPKPIDAAVVFIERNLDEVVASQCEMLRRMGKPTARTAEQLRNALEVHVRHVSAWLSYREDLRQLRVNYGRLIAGVPTESDRLGSFLGLPPDAIASMNAQIDPSLYRTRTAEKV